MRQENIAEGWQVTLRSEKDMCSDRTGYSMMQQKAVTMVGRLTYLSIIWQLVHGQSDL